MFFYKGDNASRNVLQKEKIFMAEKLPPGKERAPQPGLKKMFPPAGVIWFIILIVMASLFVMSRGMRPDVELSQSDFETKLAAGEIVFTEITSENESVLSIKGRFLLSENEFAIAKLTDPRASNEVAFRTKVLRSEALLTNIATLVPQAKVRLPSPWLTFLAGWVPLLILAVIIWFVLARQFRNSNKSAMQFGKSRAKMVQPDEINVKFDDVAGADEAKVEVMEIVEFLRDPLKFKMLGGSIPKGCLLTGPPGTGKTLLAKAVACESGVPFLSISGSDFVEMFVGVGASRVRDMFEQAKANAPCLIFIDEIDAVGRSRFSGLGGGHDEREQTLNALLVEMDGLQSRSDVIVLAATNRPDVLDKALLRPGRFDRNVVLDLPDLNGRRQILAVHLKKIRTVEDIDVDALARHTTGLSGADLANMCNEAALMAASGGREKVLQKDLEEASEKVRWGRERRSRKLTDRERRLVAYHEAGHAIVNLFCEHGDPLHKITIIPRGQALGSNYFIPEEDVYTHSKLELLDSMAMGMGGRAAEEIVFGDVTTGAAGDITQASHVARLMACVFGMVEGLGPIKYGDFREHVHVRYDAPSQDTMGPETAREIDLAVRKLVNDAHARAIAVLTRERARLDKLAQELLDKETLSAAEVYALLDIPPRKKADEPVDEPSAEPVAEPADANEE